MTRATCAWPLVAAWVCAVGWVGAAPRARAADGGAPTVVTAARQLLVVTTPGWDDVQGQMQRYARATAADTWTPVGLPIPIVVGRSGVAWDPGLPAPPVAGPVKKEGDGRSPAGAFALGLAFGYAPASEAAWLKLPYRQATPSLECVDDASSRYYNQLIERPAIGSPAWRSSEQMRRADEFYRWGVVVEYNTQPPTPGHGSCIFLHVADVPWGGTPAIGTTGCTAMTATDLEAAMRWIDPAERPALVQLPAPAYQALATAWRLP